MKFVNKPFKDGAEAWNDYVMSYGIDEALLICNNYLDLNLKREHGEDERNFTREIFQSMYETALAKAPIKILYPYPFEQAEQFWETYYYNLNCKLNLECSIDIGVAIKESCYLSNFYNLENAAWKVLLKYGFNRVNAVLAHQIQVQEYDGRYSAENKNWAENFILIPASLAGAFVDTHVALIDGIANHVRKLYIDMAAER
ncbi:MAG: DUF3849 domain-containing protein, partial [Sporomusaceae bacterium]|nr:DUF3849 domain-containing protein [Sporomusaceae bacterium]